MKRRNFVKLITAGSVGSLVGSACDRGNADTADDAGSKTEGRMVVGCQSRNEITREALEFLTRHGVYHLDPGSPEMIEGVGWDLDDALRQVEEADRFGVRIDAYHLSGGSSHFRLWPNIMLGKSPERDREIEIMQQMIQVAGKADVPLLMYNATILPVLRTGRTTDPGRGNSSYSTWNYDEALERGMDEEMTEAGVVDIDEMYERITYWLDRVLPVAEEYNVKLGNHIADPPTPAGYRGITRWNSPDIFEGIKRFGQLYDSPSHGFNLCVGSVAEGLRDPKTEILPIIEWLGERNQIFNVHLRNIKGGWGNFQEVYPDNGDMDFVQVLKKLRDVGYAGMVMPDHIPQHDDPASRDQGFAFAYGYTKALLQSMYGFDAYPEQAVV
ncbi:MAG: mannonate dehydratase [Balneolaceae bacterium]